MWPMSKLILRIPWPNLALIWSIEMKMDPQTPKIPIGLDPGEKISSVVQDHP